MAIIGVIHWAEYRNKIMGHEEIARIARVHLKIEKGDGVHRRILKRIKSNDAAPNWFLRFCTYCKDAEGAEPAQVRFDAMTWEPSPDSVERDAEEIERYIRDMTGDAPYPVKKLESDGKNHGWIKFRRDVVPWLKRNRWKSLRAGRRGTFWWLPKLGRGYVWRHTMSRAKADNAKKKPSSACQLPGSKRARTPQGGRKGIGPLSFCGRTFLSLHSVYRMAALQSRDPKTSRTVFAGSGATHRSVGVKATASMWGYQCCMEFIPRLEISPSLLALCSGIVFGTGGAVCFRKTAPPRKTRQTRVGCRDHDHVALSGRRL